MRQGGQYARAVTGILLATPSTAVIHTSQHTIRVEDNLVTAPAFDMRDKPDATAIPFQGWTVETVRFGRISSSSYIHDSYNQSPRSPADVRGHRPGTISCATFSG